MKKKAKKELALLFCSYVFLKNGLDRTDEVKDVERTENDWKIYNLFDKLRRLNPTFIKKEILNYYFTRLFLIEDSQVQMSPLILGLYLYRVYLDFREETKYINLGIGKKQVEKLFEDIKEQFGINKDEVKYAYEFSLAFFPEKAGLISFRKLTNKLFGGEYVDDLYMLKMYEEGYQIPQEIKEKASKYTDEILVKMKGIR